MSSGIRPFPGHDIKTLFRKMKRAQKSSGGFDLTVRELMEIWGYASTSAVHYALQRLEKAGLVISKRFGKSTRYRVRR